MKKCYKFLAAMLGLTLSMSTTAFAGTWEQESNGWWWQNDDGSYPQSSWQWLDGNQDGIAESYYFDENGYLLTGTTTPDGYTVDENGAWVVGGIVQQKETGSGHSGSSVSDGRQLYMEASKKNAQLSSMAAAAKVKMNMTMNGESIPLTMDMDMKFKDLDQTSLKYLVNMKINMNGKVTNGVMFYTDGYYYMDMLGQKQKVAMDLDSMTKTINSEMNLDQADAGAEYLQNVVVTNDGNGNRIVSYTSDISAFDSYLQNIYNQMGLDSAAAHLKSLNVSGVINPEGYCTSETMNMAMDISVGEDSASVDMEIEIDYSNIGQPVDFTLPSTEGYSDAGMSQ